MPSRNAEMRRPTKVDNGIVIAVVYCGIATMLGAALGAIYGSITGGFLGGHDGGIELGAYYGIYGGILSGLLFGLFEGIIAAMLCRLSLERRDIADDLSVKVMTVNGALTALGVLVLVLLVGVDGSTSFTALTVIAPGVIALGATLWTSRFITRRFESQCKAVKRRI